MTSASSLEGRRGKPFEMVVELGKIREFARATKSTHVAYDGPPGDTPVSPVTYLASAAFWMTEDSDPWRGIAHNWGRLLLGEQEFVFHGEPPRAGAVLTGSARIDRVYQKIGKRGGPLVLTDVVTEFRDRMGTLVAESRTTVIETSQAATEGRERVR